jgi:hypothetical protein
MREKKETDERGYRKIVYYSIDEIRDVEQLYTMMTPIHGTTVP